MPKASAKNKSAPHEAEIRLYKQWSLAVTPISIYTVRVIDDIFKTIKRSIADKINFETGNDQRLSSYDEKIYQFYRELMDIYHNLAEVSYTDDALLEDETVKVSDVWNGIFAVIQSRVKLFEENTAQLGGFLSELNPVVMEKKDIVSKSIKTFSESFHNTEQRFKIEKRKSLISLAIKNMICENSCEDNLVLNNALEQIQQSCFDRFYDFYSSTVAFAIINLNDLYKRREAHYYYELLMEEQQILSSIIHIQVDVLENMLSLHSSNNALREPIAILKLAHEQLNFKVEEINLLFKSTDDKNKSVENYEQFSKNILDKLSESNIFKTQAFRHAKNLFERNYTLFLKNLEDLSNKNAQKSVNQDYMKSSIYECSKIVFEHETLVDEMIEEFVRIINFYEQNKS